MWIDIACIVFICVTAIHLGLIEAVESIVGTKLPIVSCPKCLTFWAVLGYCCGEATTHTGWITVLAVSFLASYSALWLEMLEGYIDTLYMKLYGKIYASTDNTVATDADGGDSSGTVSEL